MLLATLFLLLQGVWAKNPAHILFVVIDDAGFSDFSYKGEMYNISGPLFPTPVMDGLALSGVRLESYYVHALCSPSRGAFLSGRYAYTTGGNAEVIVDGVPDQLPTNIRMIPSLLAEANWTSAAYGKWDLGMTSWGCTPMCRGFNHHSGFYNAFNDYYTHKVGDGLDLRLDFAPDKNQTGVYSTTLFGARASDWVTTQIKAGAPHTFQYLAFQAIHAPSQATQASLDACTNIPLNQPVRRIACAQMSAVDTALGGVVETYKSLGIWEDTLVVVSTDNGGNTDTGGGNYPLRGMKATMFEGGVRGLGFVSGAGLSPSVKGTVSHELYSLVDWLPTFLDIAGVPLSEAAKAMHPTYQPPPPALDGMSIWASLSQGTPSPRTWALLYLDPFNCFVGHSPIPCKVPGQGAIRVGRYKLINGHAGAYQGTTNVSSQFCGGRDGDAPPTIPALNVTAATSPPFCPTGWVMPPGGAGGAESGIRPPPGEPSCTTTPCLLPPTSPLLTGGTWLFDVVSDMMEEHDLAATLPDVVAELQARLQAINATNIPQDSSPHDPASDPSKFGGVWTPWRGDPISEHCDPNTTGVDVRSSFDGATFAGGGSGGVVTLAGWAWSPSAGQGGKAPLTVTFQVNGVQVGTQVANIPRPPGFMNKTGAPNLEHGFAWVVTPPALAANMSTGFQVVSVLVEAPTGQMVDATGSPKCYHQGQTTKCNAVD